MCSCACSCVGFVSMVLALLDLSQPQDRLTSAARTIGLEGRRRSPRERLAPGRSDGQAKIATVLAGIRETEFRVCDPLHPGGVRPNCLCEMELKITGGNAE